MFCGRHLLRLCLSAPATKAFSNPRLEGETLRQSAADEQAVDLRLGEVLHVVEKGLARLLGELLQGGRSDSPVGKSGPHHGDLPHGGDQRSGMLLNRNAWPSEA